MSMTTNTGNKPKSFFKRPTTAERQQAMRLSRFNALTTW